MSLKYGPKFARPLAQRVRSWTRVRFSLFAIFLFANFRFAICSLLICHLQFANLPFCYAHSFFPPIPWTQEPQRWPIGHLDPPKEPPNTSQARSKMRQDRPKTATRAPKSGPRGAIAISSWLHAILLFAMLLLATLLTANLLFV
mgnify:CR=1 FL=1